MFKNRTTKVLMGLLTVVVMVLAIFEVKSIIDAKNSKTVTKSATKNIGPYKIYTKQTEYQKQLEPELVQAIETKKARNIVTAASKYFVSDYFTLLNKSNPKTVGGIDFVFPASKESFRTNAIDSYYGDLPQYIKSYGKENLPLVTNVKVGKISKVHISNVYVSKKSDLQIEAVYDVAVAWEYEPNEKNRSNTLINKGKVRYVKASDKNWYIYEFHTEEGGEVNEGY